jgi:hypothetical protein
MLLVEMHILALGTNQKNNSTQLTSIGKLSLIANYLKEIDVLKSAGPDEVFELGKVDADTLKSLVVS